MNVRWAFISFICFQLLFAHPIPANILESSSSTSIHPAAQKRSVSFYPICPLSSQHLFIRELFGRVPWHRLGVGLGGEVSLKLGFGDGLTVLRFWLRPGWVWVWAQAEVVWTCVWGLGIWGKLGVVVGGLRLEWLREKVCFVLLGEKWFVGVVWGKARFLAKSVGEIVLINWLKYKLGKDWWGEWNFFRVSSHFGIMSGVLYLWGRFCGVAVNEYSVQ